MRVVVRPMHQTAKLIPFVHAAKLHAIAKSKRYAFRQIYIVRDQQRLAARQLQNKTLVAGAVPVV